MGLINPAQIVDGTTIDAADVNNPINTIANEFNGNIDNTNIKTAAAIDGSKIADGSITPAKMTSFSNLSWSTIAVNPNSVTYNGNRNYDVVFPSTDLTSSLSPGMRIKLTRNTAAPTQCTNLNGSSQYYSKASPAGMTFTGNFTTTAWIKLSSYPASNAGVIDRDSAAATASGWGMVINNSGQLQVYWRNATGFSSVTSYASIPLNKWVHIAVSANVGTPSSSVVYIDGVSVSFATSSTATTVVQPTTALTIGNRNSTSGFFPGKIAQAAVYSTALSSATILSAQNQTLSGSETSLISAYSLSGVNGANDLNTTNANNLTAQGSATTTTADAPFANAVTAGVDEYAEINSITYSTNTTINVRVPETCLLPTTGTISASYYTTQQSAYGMPYFTKVLAHVRTPGSFTTTIAGADISGLTSTVYVPQNGIIKVSLWVGRVTNVSGAGVETTATLYVDGVIDLNANGPNVNNSASAGPISVSYIKTPTVGNHTYKFQGQNSGSNTNVTFNTGAILTVELV